MAYIQIIEGVNKGVILKLKGDTLIGRAPTSILCLPDSRASREHALIRQQDDKYVITDLGSANGTYLNDRLLPKDESAPIQDGDEVVVCSTRMLFHRNDADLMGEGKPKDTAQTLQMTIKQGDLPLPDDANHYLDADQDLAALQDGEKDSSEKLLEAVKRLQAMLKISSIVAEEGSKETLLDRIVVTVLEIFPNADRVFILLPDPTSGELTPFIGRSASEEAADTLFAISRTIVNAVVEKKQSVLSCDAQSDYANISQSISELSICSVMCAPLMHKGECLGVINVDTRSATGQFGVDDLAILTGIAHQVAVAVKSLDLSDQIEEITQTT